MQFILSLFSKVLRLALACTGGLLMLCVMLFAVLATLPVLMIVFMINRQVFYRTLNFDRQAAPSVHPASPVKGSAIAAAPASARSAPAIPECDPASSAAY